MEAVGRLEEIDLELERCLTELMSSLIGQISMKAFLDVGIAGFCYENPANNLSDDERFVQARVSDDDGILSDDGGNDDGDCLTSDEGNDDDDDRSHNDEDHDIHDNFYHLHGDEGNVDSRWSGDNHGSHDSICHLCICVRNDESHGHNDDDHDLGTGDDDGENDHDDDFAGVNIVHGHCRQRA